MEDDDDDLYDTSILSTRTKPILSQTTSRMSSSMTTNTRPSRLTLNLSLRNNSMFVSQQHRSNDMPCTATKQAFPKSSGLRIDRPTSEPTGLKTKPAVKEKIPSHDFKLPTSARNQSVTTSSQGNKPLSVRKRKSDLAVPSSQSVSKQKKISNRFCPTCGLPSRMLMLDFNVHVLSCKKVGSQTKACVAKDKCISEIPKHFKEYYHPCPKQLLMEVRFPPAVSSAVTDILPAATVEATVTNTVPATLQSTAAAAKPPTAAKKNTFRFKQRSVKTISSAIGGDVRLATEVNYESLPLPHSESNRRPESAVFKQNSSDKRSTPHLRTNFQFSDEDCCIISKDNSGPSLFSSDKENSPKSSEKKVLEPQMSPLPSPQGPDSPCLLEDFNPLPGFLPSPDPQDSSCLLEGFNPPLAFLSSPDTQDSPCLLEGFNPLPGFKPSPVQSNSRSVFDFYLGPCPTESPPSYTRSVRTRSIFQGRGPESTFLNSSDDTESPIYELLSVNGDHAAGTELERQMRLIHASASSEGEPPSSGPTLEHCATVTCNNEVRPATIAKLPAIVPCNNDEDLLGNRDIVTCNEEDVTLEKYPVVALNNEDVILENCAALSGTTDETYYNTLDNQVSTYESVFPFMNITPGQEENLPLSIPANIPDSSSIYSKSTIRLTRRGTQSSRGLLESVAPSPACGDELNCSASIEYAEVGSVGLSPIRSSVVPCRCDPTPNAKSDPHDDVNATVSVRVSSSARDGPPVKINATCNAGGWDAIGIEARENVRVGGLRVELSQCQRQLTFGCTVEREGEGEGDVAVMESKFHSTMEGLGIKKCPPGINTTSPGKMPRKQQVQLSILSFMGGASRSEGTSSVARETEKITVESRGIALLSPSSVSLSGQEDRGARLIRAEKSKAEWQKLMLQKLPNKPSGGGTNGHASSSGSTYSSSSASTYANGQTRVCPFYRKITGTSFAVDAFNFGKIPGISAYFLSHFHYDHYVGLRKSFDMPLYCSSITASLVKLKIGVKNEYINVVPLHQKTIISGVTVTALDANHCPGSVMFLFQLPNRRNLLHVGDFRATPEMESYPEFWNLTVDRLFLDTTYCDPKYCFPPQADSLDQVVEYVEKHVRNQPRRTLIVCGSYTIGKERVFERIAEAMDCKIYAAADKRKILGLLENGNITSRLIDRPHDAGVHVVAMQQLRHDLLSKELAKYKDTFSNVLAFKPTGWEFKDSRSVSPVTRGNVTVVGVPYSEHSSFTELRRFVTFIKPDVVIPTVNVGKPAQREAMQRHFAAWLRDA